MMLTNLADIARKAGLNVVELPGWKTRGHGEMADVRTITCHHTAPGVRSLKAKLSLPVVRDGRPGLAGPLAHFYLDRDGTIYVVAAGLCWHAGESKSVDYTNPHAVGIEAEAAGDGWSEDWPQVQMKAYATLCRALRDAFKLDTSDVRGHKETCSPTGRKTDPSFNMHTFRVLVDASITKPEDTNDMADITDAQMNTIASKTAALILTKPISTWLDKNNDKKLDVVTVAQALGMAATDAFNASKKLDAIGDIVTKLDAVKADVADDATAARLEEIRAELLDAITPAGE